MSGVAIYMEGGGASRDTKSTLRQGMDAFLGELKDAAREKSWNWKLVCCGSREQTFRAYKNAQNSADYSLVVLLVDAEGPVARRRMPHAHLNERDGWNLDRTEDDWIHLMTQTMETWIVADVDALVSYYEEEGFLRNVIPKSDDLETIPVIEIANALARATVRTRKGKYQKIRHGSSLLRRIDPGGNYSGKLSTARPARAI